MKLKLRPWQVIFIIGNLDCDSKIIDLGKVKFYDPRKWDFGESDFIDTSKGFKINTNEEFGSNFKSFSVNHQENRIIRNSARAVMYVRAAEESSALQIARAMLLRSINFLVLEFSEKYYRFKPQTPFYYHITDIQRKHIPAGLNRAELFGIYKIDKNDEERLKVVNRFLSRTSLKDQISLSTEWYHKGLWDLSEYGKFVSYWIALERLVFEYSKLRNSSIEKVLLYYIPKVTVTWRKSSIWYAVSNHLRSILFSIRKSRSLRLKLNKDSTLSEWKKGYVLLENLEYFETLTSDRNLLKLIY